jgi:hypothetical protein
MKTNLQRSNFNHKPLIEPPDDALYDVPTIDEDFMQTRHLCEFRNVKAGPNQKVETPTKKKLDFCEFSSSMRKRPLIIQH